MTSLLPAPRKDTQQGPPGACAFGCLSREEESRAKPRRHQRNFQAFRASGLLLKYSICPLLTGLSSADWSDHLPR